MAEPSSIRRPPLAVMSVFKIVEPSLAWPKSARIGFYGPRQHRRPMPPRVPPGSTFLSKSLQNSFWPLLEATKVFFWPRRLSKSARAAILKVSELASARSWLPCPFCNDFWLQKWSPGAPRNPENQGFRVDCLQNSRFSHFQHQSPKGGPK